MTCVYVYHIMTELQKKVILPGLVSIVWDIEKFNTLSFPWEYNF